MKRNEDNDCNFRHVATALEKIARAIRELSQSNKPKETVSFGYEVGLATAKKASPQMLNVTINSEQKVNVTLVPVTAKGRPAKLDGVPTWTVQSGDGTVFPAADGLSADLVSGDVPGDTIYLVDADADLGSGVVDLQDTVTLTVTGVNATNLGLTAGQPTDK